MGGGGAGVGLFVWERGYRKEGWRVETLKFGWIFSFAVLGGGGGARGGAFGSGTALRAGRSLVRNPIMSLEFIIDIILPAALWPWDRLSL